MPDKSTAVGQRMKNAFIRSRRDAAALADDRQASPNEYAGDKVEYAADELTNDTENAAVSGTKTAVRQGRKLFQRQREKKSEEKRKEDADSPDNRPGTDSQGHPLRQDANNAPNEQPTQQHPSSAQDCSKGFGGAATNKQKVILNCNVYPSYWFIVLGGDLILAVIISSD